MANILYLKSEQQKRLRIKRKWQILCGILAATILLQNFYLLFLK